MNRRSPRADWLTNVGNRSSEALIALVRGFARLPSSVRRRLGYLASGTRIAPGTFVAHGTVIGRRTRINAASHIGRCSIGSYCAIGGRLVVRSGNHNSGYLNLQDDAQRNVIKSRKSVIGVTKGGVSIGNAVWIGDSVIVLPGVEIGNGAVIGAGSVVTKSIPAFAVAAGNPARVLRYRFPDELLPALAKVRWWDWDDRKLRDNRWLFEQDFSQPLDASIQQRLAALIQQEEAN